MDNECKMNGKLQEIYGENGIVTIKIEGDSYHTLYNIVKYLGDDITLEIKKLKEGCFAKKHKEVR